MTVGTGSTGDVTYPATLTRLSSHAIHNGGAGGETSTQIKTRMLAATEKHSWATVIWAGRNNATDPATVKADIAAMVAALGHQRYLVLGIINGDYSGEDWAGNPRYNTIVQLNADLAALYGARFIDIRSHLVSLYNPSIPQDVIDHGRDVPPSSLRSDNLHLNNAGYQTVANKVYESIAILGGN